MVNPAGTRLDSEMLTILRMRQRMTQKEVANAVRVSTVHYRRLESGEANASKELILALSQALAATPEMLYA